MLSLKFQKYTIQMTHNIKEQPLKIFFHKLCVSFVGNMIHENSGHFSETFLWQTEEKKVLKI